MIKRLALALLFCSSCFAQTKINPNQLPTTFRPANVNNIIFVDGVTYQQADIGAGSNSAYTSLGSLGGRIHVPAKASGCYTVTTPITFATLNKIGIFEGDGASASCLNYPPSTSTSAITLDWTPTSGGGYLPGGGLRDISLSNNGCVTNGGCSSSAMGVNVAPTNGGAHFAEYSNLRISGFGTAFNLIDANSASWGTVFRNFGCSWNTTCYSQSNNEEGLDFFDSKISANGTGENYANATGSSDVYHFGGSNDSNTTCGVQTNSSTLLYEEFGRHRENVGVSGNVKYICGGSETFGHFGGQILDDNATGSTTDAFVASNVLAYGPEISSAGQTFSGHVYTVNGVADIHVLDNSPSVIPQSAIAFCGNGSIVEVVAPGHQPYRCSGGAFTAGGNTPTLSGTGACATITTQVGGSWSGTFKCTGTTGASTVVITPGSTAPNGWSCPASDVTAGTAMPQSALAQTTCTIKGTVTQNDILIFTANEF